MNTIKLNTIGDSPVVVKKGSQVQSQEKTVEITENGTTEVVPDSGYALSKVTVNTNVESSGGDWHYFDISAFDDTSRKSILQMGMLHKVQGEKIESLLGADLIVPTGFGYMIPIDTTEIKAVAMDFATKIQVGGQIVTIGQSITTAPWYGTVPEITKEEFYSLEA